VELAENFAVSYGMELGLDEVILIDVVRLYSRDIYKMGLDGVAPNAYRQAGSLCIWLARLKPIAVSSFAFKASKARQHELKKKLNEIFAVYVAISVLQADYNYVAKQPGLNDLVQLLWTPAFDDLLTVLRYRVVSRHAVALLLQTICEKGLR